VPIGSDLEVLVATGYPPSVMAYWRRFAIADPAMLAQALRTNEPIWISPPGELQRRLPSHTERPPAPTTAAAPTPPPAPAGGRRGGGGGGVMGALGGRFEEAQAFDAEQRQLALRLAAECAQALDRAQAYARLQGLVDQGTEELLRINEQLQGEVAERQHAQAQ